MEKVFQEVMDYLKSATPEQLEKDFKELEKYNNQGPYISMTPFSFEGLGQERNVMHDYMDARRELWRVANEKLKRYGKELDVNQALKTRYNTFATIRCRFDTLDAYKNAHFRYCFIQDDNGGITEARITKMRFDEYGDMEIYLEEEKNDKCSWHYSDSVLSGEENIYMTIIENIDRV